jgi:hypothetical protein
MKGQSHVEEEQGREEDGRPEGLLTFAQFLEAMYAQRHTGAVTLHFAQGCPLRIEIPREPRRIHLQRAAG